MSLQVDVDGDEDEADPWDLDSPRETLPADTLAPGATAGAAALAPVPATWTESKWDTLAK